MSFIKYPSNINVDNDISIIDPEMEKKPKLTIAAEILEDSIFNHIAGLFTVIIETLNLIYIGHTSFYLTNSSNKFNYFQLGAFYLYLFGLMFSIGMIKSLKYQQERFVQYINFKIIIYFLSFLLILPFSSLSYHILNWILNKDNSPVISSNLWEVYVKFMVYAPVFFFCYLLFLLNIIFFQRNNMRASALWFCFLFIFIHSLLCYILMIQLGYGMESITLSFTISSFICYIFSNMTVSEELYKGRKVKNFNFLPQTFDFNEHFEKHLKSALFSGMSNFLNFIPYGIFLIFSFYLGENGFTSNIILINVFSILNAFSQGLSSTLKNYIQYSSIGNKHSHQAKIKYVKIFTDVVLALAVMFSLVLLAIEGDVTGIYLGKRKKEVANEISDINIFFTITIFLNFICEELEGYVRGIKIQNNLLIYKIIFPLIFIPIGFTLCFLFNYGITGIWIGIFLYIFVYSFPNGVNVYNHYDLFFQR